MISETIIIKWNGKATEELFRKLDMGLDDVADYILAKATEFCPVDEGMLKKSLHIEKEYLSKSIIADSPYAAYVEFGTRPHFPPPEPLIAWAKRVLGLKDKEAEAAGWAIARKIARFGSEPSPFLRPACDFAIPKIPEILKRQFV